MGRTKRPTTPEKVSSLRTYYTLFVVPLLLSLIGLFVVFEASSIRALSETGNSFHYLMLQMRWIVLGTVLMTIFAFFNYKKLTYAAFPIMITTIILLVAVLIPSIGIKVNGARRWIDLGFFSLQPTEFAKFATVIYLCSWFTIRERKRFFSFIFLVGILMFLILLQPDMGTASVIFLLSVVIYFLAGIETYYLWGLIPASAIGGYILIHLAPYRLQRLTVFLDPSKDPQGIGYHLNQILISLAQGGFFGRGFGASRQKYLFLPEAHTDSIFAILGEEFGFVGGIMLITIYLYLLYKLYTLHESISDRFGKLLVGGIFGYFGFQAMMNLAATVSLMPLTGVPLPFISYGGSHILTSFMLIGIAISVARSNKPKESSAPKTKTLVKIS